MKELERFAWIFGVLGVLCLIVAGAMVTAFGRDTYYNYLVGIAVSGGVLLSAYFFLDRQRVIDVGSSRAFRAGGGSVAMVVLFGAIMVAAYVLAHRHDHRWDLTGNHRFSISDATIKQVEALQSDVTVKGFFTEGSPEAKKFDDLMTGLKQHSEHLKVETHDPLSEPLEAQKNAITSDSGTVILVMGDKHQRLESKVDETAIDNALIKLQSGVDHTVCWATGHGEVDPDDDSTATGMGAIVLKLEGQNYKVTKTQVLSQGIGKECEALVVARPQQDWLPQEQEALAAYIASGGHALVLLDTGTPDAPGAVELAKSMQRFGLNVADDVVLENDPQHQLQELGPVGLAMGSGQFAPHPITTPLKSVALFVVARSVTAATDAKGLTVTELLHTTDQGASENPSATSPDAPPNRTGAIPLMAAVEVQDPSVLNIAVHKAPDAPADPTALPGLSLDPGLGVPADYAPKPGGKLVVTGDADWASNQLLRIPNNPDLFMNTIAWLVGEKDQLAEHPDDTQGQAMNLSLAEEALLWLTVLIFIPGLAATIAVIVLVRRRFL